MKNVIYFLSTLITFFLITSFKFSNKDLDVLPKEVEQAFEKALNFAQKNQDKAHFTYYFEEESEKGKNNSIKMNVDYGSFFDKNERFLIASCNYNNGFFGFYRIYIKTEKGFELAINEDIHMTGYTHLRDINGDKNVDFVINWESGTGCCPRQSKIVFLYKNKNFIKYDFLNPTFSPKEKVIRGLGYGYFPEVGLYKYKWNGTKLDTVEYIYRTKESNFKKFVRTKKQIHLPKHNQGEVLYSLPKEYQNINELDWFLKDL
ncbi:hypothetical protein Fleli_3756 [Bernardetia litoralis DSM 6794]|uniref:Uncharacterized protein n=1 Tax=Bernardetia litoralis (strain ATCC 23117 / DSM 6794 / NBRC 15988 / NCIMB 1366 / Fx l1 / Sio-4) TaxID=880071 RepID=I4AQ33_BERLS|nr:hypothetical protein [Bernardetia litoralis]AFM06068.1 hypothetical protein Fleli_3756 [Bernardetia litoralis DSM 6794]